MKEKRGGGRNEIMSVGPAVGLGHNDGAWMQRTPAIERARHRHHHHPERGERPLLLTRATALGHWPRAIARCGARVSACGTCVAHLPGVRAVWGLR